MRRLRFSGLLPILVLVAIAWLVGSVFRDYLIEHGLNPRETSLVTAVAIGCYLLGILVTYKKSDKKNP